MVPVLIITILFWGIVWLMGCFFVKLVDKGTKNESPLFIGFFLYYALFQMIALPLICTLSALSELSVLWVGCVVALSIISILYCRKDITKYLWAGVRRRAISMIDIIMIIAIIGQTALAMVQIYNGWDTAYYIANVNTSIETNTMYLYDGSTGLPERFLNFRYALSGFYMHDAVIGQVFNIPGALVCRYYNGIVCHVFSAYIVYKIGMVLWQDKKWAKLLVICSILVNCGIATVYFANAFLMERSYEAKAYCCNIIIPAVIYMILKIYRESNRMRNWIYLFIINLSSVAISESAMLLVPILNGCMLLGHCIVEKKVRDLAKMVICLLPNIFYILIYFLYLKGIVIIRIPA